MRGPPKLIGLWLLLGACFDPRYREGSPCIESCPGDLSCIGGRCVRDGAEGDAGVDAAACPENYVRNAGTGSSYRVVRTAASQTAAAADCANDGAGTYLTIPDDDAENIVLDDLATNDTWLGITDAAAEGTWVTVLGTVQTFFRWGENQPNGGTAENCAFLANAVWQDVSCALSKPYVCECK